MISEQLEETKQLRVCHSNVRPGFSLPLGLKLSRAEDEALRLLHQTDSYEASANGLGVMRPAANEQNKRRRGKRTTKRLESAENDQQAGWR